MKFKLKQIRKEKGLTQTELAQRINVSKVTIVSWEKGKCYPNASDLLLLCHVLDSSPNDILGYDTGTNRNEQELIENFRKCSNERQKSAIKTVADYATLSKLSD